MYGKLLLIDRLRSKLIRHKNVEEKVMFRGTVFMINGKMCFSVGGTELMCRFDPRHQEDVLEMPGTRPMLMKAKPCKGYVYIDETQLKEDRALDFWVNLALNFNKTIKRK